MRKTYRIFMGLAVAALVLLFQTSDISAQDVSFESLRGDVPLDELSAEPESIMQNTDRRFARAYRQQPPLIPHRIEKYQTNACAVTTGRTMLKRERRR